MRRRRATGRAARGLAALLLAGAAGAAADVPLPAGGQRAEAGVRSFLEMRERNLVRQGWDISCGAAALSTVLTHHYGAPYSEATIAVSILANTDPARVRSRGGFSLLDLKRFADAVGFTATGYANMTLADLAATGVPVIVPVRIRGLDHFVVFRGRAAGKVLVGDPAFGNLVLSEAQFADYWTSGIGFVVEPEDGVTRAQQRLAAEAMHLLVADLNYVYRLAGSVRPVPATRR